jgi:hypothetical protein
MARQCPGKGDADFKSSRLCGTFACARAHNAKIPRHHFSANVFSQVRGLPRWLPWSRTLATCGDATLRTSPKGQKRL